MKTNLHYKLIKLTNGEDIICSTDNDLSKTKKYSVIHVVDPVVVRSMRYPRGMTIIEGYVLQHWVSYATDSVFEIPLSSIVTFADIDNKMKETYLGFISEETQKMKPMLENNQLSISKEEEKDLEKILKELSKSVKEENNAEEETIKPPRGRTLH